MTQFEKSILNEKYEILSLLGVGQYSKVVLAKDLNTLKEVAVKIFIPLFSESFQSNFEKEMKVLESLDHPNIIKVIEKGQGILDDPESCPKHVIYMVFELCKNGDIFDYLKTEEKGLPEDICRFYFHQMVESVKYIHKKNICHRDLKLENIFLDDSFNLKVGDFGLCVEAKEETKIDTICGTKGYQCPEMVDKKDYCPKQNDMFALGVILFILSNGKYPFIEATNTDLKYQLLVNGEKDHFWKLVEKEEKQMSGSLKTLISGLLDSSNRFTIEDVLKNEWFNGEVCPKERGEEEMKKIREKVIKIKMESKVDLSLELFSIPEYFDF